MTRTDRALTALIAGATGLVGSELLEFLLGDRPELRVGERLGEVALRIAGPALVGFLARYRPVHARAVARAMIRASRGSGSGVRIVESPEIRRLGGETPS